MIYFQISIFEPLETAVTMSHTMAKRLWFAFKLVSLNHWKQQNNQAKQNQCVVICFQISIFEPLETALIPERSIQYSVVICFQISIFEPLETAG